MLKPTPVFLMLMATLTCSAQSPEQSDAGSAAPPRTPTDLSQATPRVTSMLLHDAFSLLNLTMAQERSLGMIEAKYPNMREQVLEARKAFRAAFQPAIEATDALMQVRDGANWAQAKKLGESTLNALNSSALTSEQAAEYISTVNRRAKGSMPHDIYVVLAALHPDYLRHPELELTRGYVQEYKTDGSGKSLGLKLSIQYPTSWVAAEGRRPHILWKASSHDSYVSAMLLVKNTPTQLTSDNDTKEALGYLTSQEYLAHEAPGAAYVAAGQTTIAGQPARYMDYEHVVSRKIGKDTVTMLMRGRYYVVIYGQTLIVFQADITEAQGGSVEAVRDAFRKHEKLFDLMALSLDIYNRY